MVDKNNKEPNEDKVSSRSELREQAKLESEQNKKNSRSKKEKKPKKNKIEDDPAYQDFLKEDVKSEEVIKEYKKKKRKHKAILFVVCLLALVSAGAGTYYYLYDTKLQEEETIVSLEQIYPEVFVDEEKTEIINIPSKQYNHIKEMFDSIPNGTEKIEFTKYQTVLDEQYGNQQAAKKAIKALKTKDGKYLSEEATQEMFDKANENVKKPFNKEYMAQLTLEIEDLYSEFEKVTIVNDKVSGFYKEGVLQEYTEKDWETLKIEMSELKNPTLKEALQVQYDTTYAEWKSREEERAEQKKKAEEKARKEAEVQAIKDAEEAALRAKAEEEARLEAEELERIKEEARAEVEAELRAEQEAKDKAKAESDALKEAEESTSETETIGANKIGINGTYRGYTSLGSSTNTETIQASIDAGNIVSSLSTFNGNDGQTTYFGGHNPGPFEFLENSISVGSTVTITDGSGKPFKYTMVEKVDTDNAGKEVIQYTGKSAIDLYLKGSGEESILIQFCNKDNSLMAYWYGVKQ